MSDYITTFSKVHFVPLDPDEDQIKIIDIAHALSLMTRANGHFPEFYSVAQHCIHCMEEAKARKYRKETQLACLLHDASEAYLADITRPVKHDLSQYLKVEEVLQNAIYRKFLGRLLTEEEQKLVKQVDDTLLYFEFKHYMGEELMDSVPCLESNPEFVTLPFKEVENTYLKYFYELNKQDRTDIDI